MTRNLKRRELVARLEQAAHDCVPEAAPRLIDGERNDLGVGTSPRRWCSIRATCNEFGTCSGP
jgi:hypothetical protein